MDQDNHTSGHDTVDQALDQTNRETSAPSEVQPDSSGGPHMSAPPPPSFDNLTAPPPPPPSHHGIPQAAAPPRPAAETKSVALAALLGFLFGPMGMLYSTVLGAAVMFLVCAFVGFVTLGFGLILTWPVCAIWAAIAANATNTRTQ